jgi:hypothetical protein
MHLRAAIPSRGLFLIFLAALTSITGSARAQTLIPRDVVEAALAAVSRGVVGSVEDVIRVRIQQTISSLPPNAPQLVSYSYDPTTDAFVRSVRPPATVVFSPNTTPRGTLTLGFSASYFELRPLEKRNNYDVSFGTFPLGVAKFGMIAETSATIVTLAASYGLMPRVELDLAIPVAIVTADAALQYSATPEGDSLLNAFLGESSFSDLTLFPSVRNMDNALAPGGRAFLRTRPLSDVGIDDLDGSTNVGLSRVSVGTKANIWNEARFRSALALSLYLPSPSEDALAGTATTSIFPKLITSVETAVWLRLHADLGYEFDFDRSDLRRFAWNVAASVSRSSWSMDVGAGGSEYQSGIRLFPDHARLEGSAFGPAFEAFSVEMVSLDDFEMPTSFVDLLFGIRFYLAPDLSLSGAATVPVVNVDFRPYAIGTISLEARF